MPNYDELITGGSASSYQRNRPFDLEEYKARKQEERDTVYGMIDDTAMQVAGDGTALQSYLDVQARFNQYTVSNGLLVLAQKPNATQLKEFDEWKERGGYVRKKENGLYILKRGDEYEREDGTIGVGYNPVKVFDISQVNGIRRPPRPALDDSMRLKAMIDTSTARLEISDTLPDGVNAVYLPENREIQVRRGLEPAALFQALAQAEAHAEMDKGDGSYDRAACAFPAYCVSYMMCKRYGVPTEGYQFDRAPAQFRGMESQEIRDDLAVIRDANREMSSRVDRALSFQREQQRKQNEPQR